MTKIAVTGPNGNIGSRLVERGCIPLNCDVTKEDEIRRAVKKASPDIIINTASKSRPDWCEKNHIDAYDVNVFGLVRLKAVAPDIPTVTLSTDHVFTGSRKFIPTLGLTKPGPYKETDKAYPINNYGLTKWAMEIVVLDTMSDVKIVRTSNCFHRKDPRVLWYIDRLYEANKVYVPTFQTRSFMHIDHFVDNLLKYIDNFDNMPKLLHISGSKTVDWYTFVLAFAEAIGVPKALSKKLTKKRFETEKFIAKRPKKVGLNVDLSAKMRLPQHDYLDGLNKMVRLGE